MKRTTVREHERRTKNGRTNVRKHDRQFSNRKVKFRKSYRSINQLEGDYISQGYRKPHAAMTNPKGSDFEMVLEKKNDSREHHRIFEKSKEFKIESHIDIVSPMKDPVGHAGKDVIAPEVNPKLREDNFNDTQIIKVKKTKD